MKALLLDGPMGTELGRKGHLLPEGLWSAHALLDAPDAVLQVHREYARAGAQVHTANTFRTKRRSMGDAWREAMQIAVGLAREGAEVGQRVTGSVAPFLVG